MRRTAFAAFAGALVIGGAPAAQAASSHAPGDPWERFNRAGYAVEGALDRVLLHPAAVLFRKISPGVAGQGVHNALVNLSEPSAFFNDMLQLRFRRAANTAGRFVTNSTIGFLGLFDVASHLGMVHRDNEFGVTLGRYGVHSGPYLYLPLVGPTTVRDLIGTGVDAALNPLHWVNYANRPGISTGVAVATGLDLKVTTEPQLNALLSDAADPYATLRSVYLQNKEGEVRGDTAPIDNLPTFDEPTGPAAPAPATAGATPVGDDPQPAAPPPN